MTERDKAVKILAKLAAMHRSAVYLEPEDIEYGCTSEQLDFYYFWICRGGGIKKGE